MPDRFQTVTTNLSAPINSESGLYQPTPLHLFHTEAGLLLKPGQHLVAAAGDTLADTPANLHLARTALIPDSDYVELNQQSAADQQIFRMVMDVQITNVITAAAAKLSAQLNVPLNMPDNHELQTRVLTAEGWIDFISDDHNHIAAAQRLSNGDCPEVSSALYQSKLNAGSECVQITIQDGGVNDVDSAIDGNIALTLGSVLKRVEPVSIPLPEDEATPSNQGGGAWSWCMSLVLLFRLRRSKMG